MSAAIQDSAASPSVQSLFCSTACSKRLCLASETHDAWNRADPIFDASCLVSTNLSKSRGWSYYGLRLKDQKWPISTRTIFYSLFNPRPFFYGPFLYSATLQHQHQQQNNTKLSSSLEDSQDGGTLTICPRVLRLCHIWNSAR